MNSKNNKFQKGGRVRKINKVGAREVKLKSAGNEQVVMVKNKAQSWGEELVAEVFSRLLLSADIGLELLGVLKLMGLAMGAERVRVVLLSDDRVNLELVQEWGSVKRSSQKFESLEARQMPWLMSRLWGCKPAIVGQTDKEIPERFNDRVVLSEQGIERIAIFPMPVYRTTGGFVEFDNGPQQWNEEQVGVIDQIVRAIGNSITRSLSVTKKGVDISYRGVLESINEAVFVLDNNDRIREVNRVVPLWFGLEKRYFIGKELKQLMGVFPVEVVNEIFRNIELSKLNMLVEPRDMVVTGSTGEVRDVSIQVLPWKDDKKSLGNLVVVRDISVRKAMEREVVASESQLRSVLESVKEGITLSDSQGRFLIYNQEMEELTGYTRDEANGSGEFNQLIHPDDRGSETFSRLAELKVGEKSVGKTVITTKNGNRKRLLVSTTMMEQENRKLFLSAYRDITDLELYQEELSQRYKELQETTSKLHQTTDELIQARDHLEEQVELKTKELQEKVKEAEDFAKFVSEEPFPVLRISERGEFMYGNSASQVLLQRWQIGEGQVIPEPWFSRVGEVWRSNNRTIFEEEFFGQVLAFVLVPVKSMGYINIYGHDVTREKEIAQVKNEFISMVSHQIRTPLTSVRWYSEMLEKNGANLSQEQLETVRVIHHTAVKLAEMVTDLLNISRMESGKLDYQPQKHVLNDLVGEVIKEIAPQADKKSIKLEVDMERVENIMFDQKLVREVYLNLLSNAIKYTYSGGVVKLVVRIEDEAVVSEVIDEGIGIPAEAQAMIFSRFYRAQNAVDKEIEGTGLGLAVARMMVEKWGGKIWFKSPIYPEKIHVGQAGSLFGFNIPLMTV